MGSAPGRGLASTNAELAGTEFIVARARERHRRRRAIPGETGVRHQSHIHRRSRRLDLTDRCTLATTAVGRSTGSRRKESDTRPIPLYFLLLSQAMISSIFVSTNRARRRLNFGSMGGLLVSKLVKPTKVFGSWPPHQSGIDQLLLP